VSIFVVRYERGQSVSLHLHPYPEVFVVESGTARFTVGDEQLEVAAGNVVIVPAQTPHGFEGVTDETLHVVSVHPRGKVEQTDL
jgi:quercetin dioxygenase-like cupin family protein